MSYSDRERGARRGFDPRAVYSIVFIGFSLFSNYARGDDSPVDIASSILSEIEGLVEKGLDRGEQTEGRGIVVESLCLDFEYPVKTRLEMKSGAVEWRDEAPLLARFRRTDKATVTQDGSPNDYMSTYYAQRKAIMDKYNSQRKEISGRLERTKSLIAAKQRLKESKAKVQPGNENATRGRERDAPLPNVPRHDSTTADPNPSSPFDFERAEHDPGHPRPEAPTLDTDTVNATATPISLEGWTTLSYDATDAVALENSIEPNLPPNGSLSEIYTTVPPFENNETGIDGIPDDMPEENFSPHDRVDVNFAAVNPAIPGRDNETLIIDLGGHLTDHHPWRNDSASAELDKMFLWDAERREERFDLANSTVAQREEGGESLRSANTIVADDQPDPSGAPLTADGGSVRVESSPGVHVTKRVKNVQSSTTTYRNLTHEIMEVNGVVARVNRIDGASPAGVDDQTADANSTNANSSAPGEVYGGARESEWCEECPHDYRWGECEGTLFYQHNIFLRNRGPSAIDAVFGMEVDGPVDVTCVEALRFNRTRGIVSLHSGGPGNDFAKLRIRGFQGEGFSYIMKVWGVNSRDSASSTSHP